MSSASPADLNALLDSLTACDARRDWVAGVLFAERLETLRPGDHGVLLLRGTLWSNFAVEQRAGRLRPRPALRTSLERMECLGRAIGLIDSSASAARDSAQWSESVERWAQLDESLGLTGDALIAYEAIKPRLPNAATRSYWLRALFHDPVHPDTSLWRRQRLENTAPS